MKPSKTLHIEILLKSNDELAIELRKNVRQALIQIGLMPVWQEYFVNNEHNPAYTRKYQETTLFIETKPVSEDMIHSMDTIVQKMEESLRKKNNGAWFRKPAALFSVLPGLVVAFFPKCAFCWAAYLSAFNSLGFGTIPYMPWLQEVFVGLMIVSLFILYRGAKRRNKWIPFLLQLKGMFTVIMAKFVLGSTFMVWSGIACIFAGSLLNAMPDSWYEYLIDSARLVFYKLRLSINKGIAGF